MFAQIKTAVENNRVCPWWMAYTFDNPIRKFFHQPRKMLDAFVKEGMTVMDVGCGMGFFSIGMAKMVGDSGKVIAVDLQQKMLDIMLKRARRAGVAERIFPHRCEPDRLAVSEKVDFILTFWMVHEVGNQRDFFRQLRGLVAPEGKILIAEPRMHVSPELFQETIETAKSTGFQLLEQPPIRLSLAALLRVRSG